MKNAQTKSDEAMAQIPQAIQKDLKKALTKGGVIPVELVLKWLKIPGTTLEQIMIQLLPVAATFARTPISNFNVGAVALGMSTTTSEALQPGTIYLGSNMEFPGETLNFSIHGEQSATNNAWLHGETGLQAIAINAAPCGYCRQFLYEITTAKAFSILLKIPNTNDNSYTKQLLTHYLPEAFGPQDLGVTGGLMKTETHQLTLTSSSANAQAALKHAKASYSPYTNNYSGVALVGSDGNTYTGRYAENAAYNPSLSPMASALAFMNMNLAPQTDLTINEATLVETPAKASQKEASIAILSSVAPTVTLEYCSAQMAEAIDR